MQQHDIAPHFETLQRALGDKIGTEIQEQDLKDELAKYLEYGVPADQAVKTILRHHGVQGGMTPTAAPVSDNGEAVPLGEVPPNVPAITLEARLVTLNTKTVMARGEEKEIYWGLLGDATGTLSYTSWRPLEGLAKGDCIRVRGAYTKEFRNEVQVNFGDRTQIEKLEDDAVAKVATTFKEVAIGDIEEGMRALRLTGRILDVAPREITVQGEPKTIYGGTLADDSGKIEFTSWHDHGLVADQVVTIEGGYVRAYRGVPQLNFDADANVSKADVDMPEADVLDVANRMTLGDIIAKGGANDVEVLATLLEVRPGSGLIKRDPQTRRVLAPGQKPAEGEAVWDLRIKAVLDDGTGAVNMVAGKELTESILGKNLDACRVEAQEAMGTEVIQDELKAKLQGRVYVARGNVLSDDFGPMFLVRSLVAHVPDPMKDAEDLFAKLPPEAL